MVSPAELRRNQNPVAVEVLLPKMPQQHRTNRLAALCCARSKEKPRHVDDPLGDAGAFFDLACAEGAGEAVGADACAWGYACNHRCQSREAPVIRTHENGLHEAILIRIFTKLHHF